MRIDNPTGFTSNLTGSFTGSFFGDGSGLTGTDSGSWDGDFVGPAKITGSLSLSGSFKDQESSPGTAGQVLSSTVSGSQWVDVGGSGIGDVTKTGTITANQIAIWNNTTNQLRSDPTFVIDSNHKITLYQPTGATDKNNYNIGGGNINTVTGISNTGFGKDNLSVVTEGYQNIALGGDALKRLTLGAKNIGIGNQSAQNITEGLFNIAIGYQSLNVVTTTSNNIGIGNNSLAGTTGTANIVIGNSAGSAITTGSKNVIIGSNNGSTIAALSNNIIISDGDGNNRLQFGSTGAATFSGAVTSKDLNVVDAYANDPLIKLATNTSSNVEVEMRTATTSYNAGIGVVTSGYDFNLFTANTPRLTISSGGVVIVGSQPVPSWISGRDIIQLGDRGNINAINSSGNIYINNNIYVLANGNNASVKAGGASQIRLSDNDILFYTSNVASAANEVITLTPKLTIASGGTATFEGLIKGKSGYQILNGATAYGGLYTYAAISGAGTDYNPTLFSEGNLYFATGGTATKKLTIATKGIVGIGVTPKTDPFGFGGNQFQMLQFGGVGCIGSYNNVGEAMFSNNVYVSATVGTFAPITTGNGSAIFCYTDKIDFKSAVNNGDGTMSTIRRVSIADGTTTGHSTGALELYGAGTTLTEAGNPPAFVNHYLDTGNNYYISTGFKTATQDIQIINSSAGVLLDYAATSWQSNSDENIKENIIPLENVLGKIKDIRCVNYNFKDEDIYKKRLGFIAQDFQEDFEEVVGKSSDGVLGLHYTETIPILMKAIQEQQTIIEDLKARIETLEG